MSAPDFKSALVACIAEIVPALESRAPEITLSQVFDALKIATVVILVAVMGAMKKSRQLARVPRRPVRTTLAKRKARAKISLNSGRGPGSKPQGGAS